MFKTGLKTKRTEFLARSTYRFIQVLTIILLLTLVPLQGVHNLAFAAGTSYDVDWFAADPALNRGQYDPTYMKMTPDNWTAAYGPFPTGRDADPLQNAVLYSPLSPFARDGVTSLEPSYMTLGQITPFEYEIIVDGTTDPEGGVILLEGEWRTHSTSGCNFGYDPDHGIIAAFIDTAEPVTIDPGADATVEGIVSTIINPGTSTEAIGGIIEVSGLDDGDHVIVEVWVVLKDTIACSGGTVQATLKDGQTVHTPPELINTGNRIIPMGQLGSFFSDVDLLLTKSDSPDPVNTQFGATSFNLHSSRFEYSPSGYPKYR